MRITKLDAIKSLCPTVELTVEGDSIITFWSDDSVAKPTDSQLNSYETAGNTDQTNQGVRVLGPRGPKLGPRGPKIGPGALI